MEIVAVIGDVGGFADHLRCALASLGVTDVVWPDGLHVIQLGDLLGGRDDREVVDLVGPHIEAGRWTQLIGNWELAAVGGHAIVSGDQRTADVDALRTFAEWHQAGRVRWAAEVTMPGGAVGVVTHAGIGYEFWADDLDGDRDARSVVERLNAMDNTQIARPGEMYGAFDERAPGPVWASTAEVWSGWKVCPWPQIHGHASAYSSETGWRPYAPANLRRHTTVNDTHVTFTPTERSAPIIGIDPGLDASSPLGSLRPLAVTGIGVRVVGSDSHPPRS